MSIFIGEYNDLFFERDTPQGWYLTDNEGNDVLLPNKYCPEYAEQGMPISVFVYRDSLERPVATTLEPKLTLYRFAYLEIVDTSRLGAFADFGMEKHLFIPYKEMHERLQPGDGAVIFMFLDSVTDRLVGSARVTKWLDRENVDLPRGKKVQMMCFDTNDVGYKMIVDGQYQGILYKNEVFQPIELGEVYDGFVRTIRENGHIDLSLTALGRGKIPTASENILKAIKDQGGFLALHDKSSPEYIMDVLQMSKKSFKEAIGKLYREKAIEILDDGIRLLK